MGAVTVNPVNVPTEVMAGCAAVVTVPAVVALVAVAALPVMLPAIGLVTVRLPRVPTEVSEELTTFDARVVPVKVLASATAVTVMSADPSKGTPLMFFVAASLVAVPALPVILVWSPVLVPDKFATAAFASMALVIAPLAIAVAFPTLVTGPVKLALVVTVAALPVILPAMGAVTVNPVNVPTEVMAGCAAVVTVPAVVAVVAVAALPVMLPAIGLVTVKLPSVPTEVSEELTTFDARVVPVRVLASATAVTVMSADPSNGTPLMFFVAASFVAVPALPVILV